MKHEELERIALSRPEVKAEFDALEAIMNDRAHDKQFLTDEALSRDNVRAAMATLSPMTIDQAKQAKSALQERIGAILMDFSYATGLTVEYINVETVDGYYGKSQMYAVTVEAKL